MSERGNHIHHSCPVAKKKKKPVQNNLGLKGIQTCNFAMQCSTQLTYQVNQELENCNLIYTKTRTPDKSCTRKMFHLQLNDISTIKNFIIILTFGSVKIYVICDDLPFYVRSFSQLHLFLWNPFSAHKSVNASMEIPHQPNTTTLHTLSCLETQNKLKN